MQIAYQDIPLACEYDADHIEEYCNIVATLVESKFSGILEEEWLQAVQQDTSLQEVISALTKKQLPENETLSAFKHVFSELNVQGGILKRVDLLVAPLILKNRILELAHEGHIGMRAMKRRLREVFWWPGMDRSVEHFVRDCISCATSDKTQVTFPSPVEAVPIPDKSWFKVAVDIIGPMLMLGEKNHYGIVLVDYCSRWPEVKFVQSANSEEIIKFLLSLFLKEGSPNELVSDNGAQFMSKEFQDFLEQWGIKHITTSLYHPRSNGLVERCNRVIKDNIQLSLVNGLDWKKELSNLLWALRTTPNAVTKVSPFTLLKGRIASSKLVTPWMGVTNSPRINADQVKAERVKAQNK